MTSDAPQHDRVIVRHPSGAGDDLYETDFYAWTEQQAALLRAGDFDLADLANIVEEIESSGRSQRAALESAYRLVALHLLKMMFQPERAGRSWRVTVTRERVAAARVLRDNPGLKAKKTELFASAYQDAREEAAGETGLPLSVVPKAPPFGLEAIDDRDFWPHA